MRHDDEAHVPQARHVPEPLERFSSTASVSVATDQRLWWNEGQVHLPGHLIRRGLSLS
ncbi:MAG: hypothetical protein JOZ81_12350 [Chloroflexi bacterium]|nr:hypothetical protein [Chloroflexota bacterium]